MLSPRSIHETNALRCLKLVDRFRRLEISALTPDDTTECLRMRMECAGCTREVFAGDAIVLLHEATIGAMRDLDRPAAAALRETARKERKLVERDVVSRVIETDTRERDR